MSNFFEHFEIPIFGIIDEDFFQNSSRKVIDVDYIDISDEVNNKNTNSEEINKIC